jgi:hypothetical protein
MKTHCLCCYGLLMAVLGRATLAQANTMQIQGYLASLLGTAGFSATQIQGQPSNNSN